MTRLAFLFAALGALAACAAPGADALPPVRGADTGCAIREVQGRAGVELSPIVWSRRPVSGEYSFTVDKYGLGGSASVEQGGPLDIGPGRTERLGSVAVGERPMRYRARLVVSDRGRPVCVATAPDRS